MAFILPKKEDEVAGPTRTAAPLLNPTAVTKPVAPAPIAAPGMPAPAPVATAPKWADTPAGKAAQEQHNTQLGLPAGTVTAPAAAPAPVGLAPTQVNAGNAMMLAANSASQQRNANGGQLPPQLMPRTDVNTEVAQGQKTATTPTLYQNQQGGGQLTKPEAPGPTQAQDISSMWADVLKDHDVGKDQLFSQANADEANASRRNAEMNAVTGGGAGGAFAGGQAQTAIGGMQARQKALSDFNKQGVELKMARLDQLIKQAEASGDRNLQRELQAEADKTSLMLKQLDMQGGIDQTNSMTNSVNSTGGY